MNAINNSLLNIKYPVLVGEITQSLQDGVLTFGEIQRVTSHLGLYTDAYERSAMRGLAADVRHGKVKLVDPSVGVLLAGFDAPVRPRSMAGRLGGLFRSVADRVANWTR